jgi:hypothetical protein
MGGPTSPGMTAPDGFKQACANGYCWQNGEPITVWRNPGYTPVFDGAYRYTFAPMHIGGKSIDVTYGSTNNGTPVQQFGSWNGDSQKFAILPIGSNWKITMKANTNKCFGSLGGGTGNGTRVEIQDCNGSNSQAWTITADANTGGFTIKNVAANRCLEVPYGSGADGALLDLYDCHGGNNQKFKLTSSY